MAIALSFDIKDFTTKVVMDAQNWRAEEPKGN